MRVASGLFHLKMYGPMVEFPSIDTLSSGGVSILTRSRIRRKQLFHFVHYCPVNSFPTNPTSIGMRDPKNPPSCIKCFLFLSDVFFLTNALKHSLYLLSLSFSSSVTGILYCNILWTQSQIQWTSSIPPSSIIRLHFCLSYLTSLIAFNSRENTCTL